MVPAATTTLVRQIESLFAGGSVAGLSDRQLIEQFVSGRDSLAAEAAFAAIVSRHGPMVLYVCRQLLGDHQHAEDAFQAVFLVLARRARSVRDPELLSQWLYGVALRTARNARRRLARNRRREEDLAMQRLEAGLARPADQPAIDREQAEALHAEIDRLPATTRLPVILCYFEGLSLAEAARRLRCPAGTIHSRLDRARETLRRGLRRRGFLLSTTAVATMLSARSASASIPPLLCDSTTRAAIAFAARHAAVGGALSAPAAALAQEVLKTMLIHKLRAAALSLVLLVALTTVVAYRAMSAFTQSREGEPPGEPSAQTARTEPRPPEPTQPSLAPGPGRMTVAGRVLDPGGNPVPGASVMVHARSVALGRAPYLARRRSISLANAHTDGSGRFRIDAPRTSSTRHEEFVAMAMAPGHGVGWVRLDPDDDEPAAEISLRPEQVIQGRLFDVQGRPVPDVGVSVQSIQSALPRARASLHDRSVYRRYDGVSFLFREARDEPAWPQPTTTDAEGRFTVRGVGRNLQATLAVHDPRFARQMIQVDTDDRAESKTVTAALAPSQIVNVRVTYADTGQPVPHAPLRVMASRGRVQTVDESETDAEGKARINSYPADRFYNVTAYPPEGQPYLLASGRINWPKGALEQTLDIALPRGVLVQGKVTEEGSGRPVSGALVEFTTRRGPMGQDLSMLVHTDSDGSFRIGAEPKPGHVFIRAPDDDYVFRAIGSRLVMDGQPGGGRLYSHAFAALDLKPGMNSQEVNLILRRGATVEGRVVGPDGQPVRDAWIFSRVILDPSRDAWVSWTGRYHATLRNGRFELRGLAPDVELAVYFLEPERKLGAVVNLSARSAAGGPVIVRLEPCGTARACLVDPDGKPIAQPVPDLDVTMVVTPGPARNNFPSEKATSVLHADEGTLTQLDPINYDKAPAPDASGRLTLPVLIPGATYRIIDYTMFVRGQTGPEIRKEFTVKPGETLDLGNIPIAKPPR
jgi:RNA polymerase sigma factor (sigma-70 family)